MNNTDYLSIAINESLIRYALFDEDQNLKVKKQIATPKDNVDNFLKRIYTIIDEHIKSIRGIGLCVPGQVDHDNGLIYQGGSLPMLHGLSLETIIESRYELPVAMENTGICVAIAAQQRGNLKDINNGAVILLADGVTSGLILQNQIFSGAHLQAGSIGMMPARLPFDNFQTKNMMFNACSATQMVHAIGATLKLTDPDDDTKVFKAIENGDANAREMFNRYCKNIATMIINMQAVLDLSKYIISGRISNQSILVPEINHQLQLIFDTVPPLKDSLQIPEVETSHFKQDTELYGAYFNALNRLNPHNKSEYGN